MLSYKTKGVSGENSILEGHYRKQILILTILVFTLATLLTMKLVDDYLKQKRGEDIISSAQRESTQILEKAENDATEILVKAENEATNAKNEAGVEAATITDEAKSNAETIIKNAEDEAEKIIAKAKSAKVDEVEILLAVTEAEASNQPLEGRAAVASTIINRVESSKFKEDTIKAVVYAPGQFDVVANGRINRVRPSRVTREAVRLSLEGKDYSRGALYFYNPQASGHASRQWFNTMRTTTVIGDHVFKR